MRKNEPQDRTELFNKPLPKFTAEDQSILFEQYKLYVELMDKVSERRNQANAFFLTVNVLLISGLSSFLALAEKPEKENAWMISVALAGLAFSLVWLRLIQSYKQLNTGKFVIIHMLEARLPANLFKAEWDVLRHGDGTVYYPFSHLEMRIPLVFMILYLVPILGLVVEVFQRRP